MASHFLTVALLASSTLATPILRGPGMRHLSIPSAGKTRRSTTGENDDIIIRSPSSRRNVVDENDIFARSAEAPRPLVDDNDIFIRSAKYEDDIIIRAVEQLDEAATEEAHQRDETATRAFSDISITTSDGKCLSVDKLSGDFRANLTPVQMVDCGTTDGEGWDIITSGVHNDREGAMLVVSTLTQACLNFDPRRVAGDQVNLFSCGGRAAGEGEVTDSQLFMFTDGETSLSLKPVNAEGSQCLTGSGERLGIAACGDDTADQVFNLGAGTGGDGDDTGDDECVPDDEDDEAETPLPTPTPAV